MAKPLSPAQREELLGEAYALSLRGYSAREIGRTLGVSDKTAGRLVRQEAQRRSSERPDYLQRAIDSHQQLIKRIWQVLDSGSPSEHALAQLAHAVTNAQSQLDKITGVLAPVKADVRMTITQENCVQSLADGPLEAVVILTQAGAAGEDGEDALREIVRRYQAGTLAPKFTVSSADLLEMVPPKDRHRVENLDELLALESPEVIHLEDED